MIANVLELTQIVRGHEHRRAVFGDVGHDDAPYLAAHNGVEPVDRLVENEYLRPKRDRYPEGGLLLHALGKPAHLALLVELEHITELFKALLVEVRIYAAVEIRHLAYDKIRKIEDIVAEAKSLAENGVKELVVIAQDSTMYGSDIYGEARLPQLLEELAKIDGLKWIRIMYSYPESITKELVDVIRRHDNICSYFDMPIQHASNKILKLMNRQTTKEELLEKVNMIRSAIPNATLRTTLITGFPGEDEKDFEELVEFVKEVKFDKLGVFPYSREEGTAADKLPNHLEQEVKEQRRDIIMMIQQEISEEINKNKVGNTYEVLIEEQIENNVYVGRTQFDAEEIDSIVYVKSHTELEPGDFVNVKINTALEYDLMGDIQDEFAK